MKKFFITTVIMALIAVFALTIVGCYEDKVSDDAPLEPVSDTTGVTLWQVVERIGASKNINPAEAMNLSLGGLLEIESGRVSKRLRYEVKANVNTVDGIGDAYNNNFYVRINDDETDETVVGIFADGRDLYLDFGKAAYKYENVSFNSAAADGNQRIVINAESIVTMLGELLFSDAKTNGDVYEFDYDLGSVSESILPIIFLFANADIDAFAEELGFVDFNDMTVKLSEYSGKLVFDFHAETFNGATFEFNGHGNKFGLTLGEINIKGENEAIDYESIIPDRDYVVTKAINIKSSGDFYLDTNNGTTAKYTWDLIADIDPFKHKSIADNDDVFHLVVKNNTADNTAEFNNSKINATDGVVLELAYAPKQFNTDNLLIAIDLKSILSREILTSSGVDATLGKLLPNYFGSHVDLEFLGEVGNNGSVITRDAGKNRGITDIFKFIKFDNGSIEVKRELLTTILGENTLIDSLLDTESSQTESFKLIVNFMSYGGNNKDYALKEHFLYAANDNGGSKNFGLGFMPAKSSVPVTDEGYAIMTDVYGNKINSRTDKIGYEELGLLIGGKINYNFTDFWDAERSGNTPVKILGISGVDRNLFGVEQTVNILTSMPDGNNLMGLLNKFKVDIDLPTNVYQVKIILTETDGAEFLPKYSAESYRIGDRLPLAGDDCVMRIKFKDGVERSYSASAISSQVPTVVRDGVEVLSQAGEYAVIYSFGNMKYERVINVIAPEVVMFKIIDNFGFNNDAVPNRIGTAKLIYGNGSTEMPITSDMAIFPKGAVCDGKLIEYGDYYVKIGAYGGECVKRIKVFPESNRYAMTISGNKDSAEIKLVTSRLSDRAPESVKLEVKQDKKVLGTWIPNGDVNAAIDGVNIKDYRFSLPFVGDKTIKLTLSNTESDADVRLRVQAIDITSGDVIAENITEVLPQ